MPRGAAKRILVQGFNALKAEASAEAQALGKAARAFSSVAGRNGIIGQTAVRGACNSLAAKSCKCACGKTFCMGNHYHTSVGAAQAEAALADEAPHAPSLTQRHLEVLKHFPNALGVDDFIARLEMALAAYGFTGDNAIGESRSAIVRSLLLLSASTFAFEQCGDGVYSVYRVVYTCSSPEI